MSDKRSTEKVTTSSGKVVEFYNYLTGREENEIQKIYIAGAKYKVAGVKAEEVEIESFDATAAIDAKEKLVELLIVSVGGEKENAANVVLDLPAPEYNEVIKALDKATGKKGD